MKYRPTRKNRKKIGKVFYHRNDFPIWVNNSVALTTITIEIHDNGRIDSFIVDDLKFDRMFVGNNKIICYILVDYRYVRDALQELQKYFKVEIDNEKLDKFLHPLIKSLVVRRLSGGQNEI